MPREPSKKAKTAGGRPRLVNQVLLDRMVALRKQGFTQREIAEKVGRSERTVRRYVRGVVPELELPSTPKQVDVLAWCSARIVAWRKRWSLTGVEVDSLIKQLREAIDAKDPITQDWLATDREARKEFLVEEFLPPALGLMESDRLVQRMMDEIGPDFGPG